MKKKELRFAVVLFGGVSLAIYQYGISREILNLIRASKLCHRGEGRGSEMRSPAFSAHYPDEPASSTGDIYLELLGNLKSDLDLRVMVDVITGASAGGINGVALATSLAHDLSLHPLKDLWLTDADLLSLLSPEARAGLWSKWYVRPLLPALVSRLEREGFLPGKATEEVKARISAFLRSRWFKPPLDGRRLTNLILDGLAAMWRSGSASGSLLPANTTLELLLTVTDFRGLDRAIFLHDPPIIHEKDHRLLLRFRMEQHGSGHLRSDFDADNLPSIAFAARASAAFPGAFAPAQLGEIDSIMAERRAQWPARAEFLERNFRRYLDAGIDPGEAVLIDGSVLDNKPILACIHAIYPHGATREVDRRLVFIDPRPGRSGVPTQGPAPGFFAILRAALSDLPRHSPVFNELAIVSRHNRQARRLKTTITNARGHVTRLVEQAAGGKFGERFTQSDLTHWRLASLNLLRETAIVYDAWMRSLVLEALDYVVQTINSICHYAPESREADAVQNAMENWAKHEGVIVESYEIPDTIYDNADLPAFARFVLDFGVVYKKRRLSFLLYEINGLYHELGAECSASAESETLDILKLRFQKCLDALVAHEGTKSLSRQALERCRELFLVAPNELPLLYEAADVYFEQKLHVDDISQWVKRLNEERDLAQVLNDTEAILASPLLFTIREQFRVAILTAYLGYFYWDILLRPVANILSLDAGPIEEIVVDRISPEDTNIVSCSTGKSPLLGASLGGFGGFLGRRARENDYLWGRLHGVDRLLDILFDTTPIPLRDRLDITALKKRAFQCVLDEEAAQLSSIPELLRELADAIASI